MVGHLSVWPVSPAGFAANGFYLFLCGKYKEIPFSDSV
jgi:hypothetical protein